MYKIKKGLDLPISGHATGDFVVAKTKKVGVLGTDFVGMKPKMLVQVGDVVQKGTKLFEDKKTPGVFFTAPASGKISHINRGAQRRLLSVVIEKDEGESLSFPSFALNDLKTLNPDTIREILIDSGSWASFRTRPFSKTPATDSKPHSIFVTATDSNPLALDPQIVIQKRQDDFIAGLYIISQLCEGKTFVCKKANADFSVGDASVDVAEFEGPHPAGIVGTHIHFLDPVDQNKTVWHLSYQEVIAIGSLFLKGELDSTRYISLAGPVVNEPAFIETELGADISALLPDDKTDVAKRVINGSVLSGQKVVENTGFLGRFSSQISLLEEGDHKEFIGWLKPGANKFTATRTYLGGFAAATKKFNLTTSSGGSPRAMVPIGVYEKVMPLDILPTLLLKSLIMKDTDEAQKLGCLELDEEDLALCTFVCPSKYEYGAILRENLEQIERDG